MNYIRAAFFKESSQPRAVTPHRSTTCNHFTARRGEALPPAGQHVAGRLHRSLSVPAADALLLRDEAPVGRGPVARQPVEVIHQVPVVAVSIQPRRLEVRLDARVAPRVGREGHLAAVLDDGPAGHLHVEAAAAGAVRAELLAGHHQLALAAAVHQHGGGDGPAQHGAAAALAHPQRVGVAAEPHLAAAQLLQHHVVLQQLGRAQLQLPALGAAEAAQRRPARLPLGAARGRRLGALLGLGGARLGARGRFLLQIAEGELLLGLQLLPPGRQVGLQSGHGLLALPHLVGRQEAHALGQQLLQPLQPRGRLLGSPRRQQRLHRLSLPPEGGGEELAALLPHRLRLLQLPLPRHAALPLRLPPLQPLGQRRGRGTAGLGPQGRHEGGRRPPLLSRRLHLCAPSRPRRGGRREGRGLRGFKGAAPRGGMGCHG